MNHQQLKPRPETSIIDLIDDALTVVSAQQAKKILGLLDETHRLLLETRPRPHDREAVQALRSIAQSLGELASYHGFAAGVDAAFAVDALTARLLVNSRVAQAEWERALVMEEHAFALLGPRK